MQVVEYPIALWAFEDVNLRGLLEVLVIRERSHRTSREERLQALLKGRLHGVRIRHYSRRTLQ